MNDTRKQRTPRSVLVAAALLLPLACATTSDVPPGLEWADSAPPEFPREGASVDETLASMVARRTTNALVQARDVRVMRIDVEPWETVPLKDAQEGRLPAAEGHYAVAASLNCQARAGLDRIYGEKAAWYLFDAGELVAWDHHEFGDACTMFNSFQPARGERVADEKRILAWMREVLPPSVEHASELYLKGAAYARAGRLEDARAMLEAGDEAFDFATDLKIPLRDDRGRRFTADRTSLRAGRDVLIRELRAAEATAGGADPPAAGPDAP